MVRRVRVMVTATALLAVAVAAFIPTVALGASWSFTSSGSVVSVSRSLDDTSAASPDLYVYSAYEGGAVPVPGSSVWDTSSYGSGGLYAIGSGLCRGWSVPVSGVSLLRVSGDGIEERYVAVVGADRPVSVAGTVPVSWADGSGVSIRGTVPLDPADRDTFDVVMAAAVLGCVGVFTLAGYRLSRGA